MIENKNAKTGQNNYNPLSEVEIKRHEGLDTRSAEETKIGWTWFDAILPNVSEEMNTDEKYIKERAIKKAQS